MLRRIASLLVLLGVASGCGEPSAGSQVGGEAVQCKAVATTTLAMGEDSVLGFSGADVLALAEGEHAATLAWKKGGSTQATVTIASSGAQARYLEMAYVDDGSGIEPAIDCADVVEVDVTVAFATADGAFDESWTTKLAAPLPDHAAWSTELDLDALQGSYTVTEVDPAAFDGVRAFLDIELDAGGVGGQITGQATSSSPGDDPDGTASAMMFDIATF